MQCITAAGIFAGILEGKLLEPAPVLDVWLPPAPPVKPNLGPLKATFPLRKSM
jgi:hypothetical protein